METVVATVNLADAQPAAAAGPATNTNSTPDFGSFVESAPNELKELFNKNGVKDFDTLAKSYNGLNSMLGKKGLVKPADDAPEAEKEAYTKSLYKELGVPEDGKYEYQLPEKFGPEGQYKDHLDQDFQKGFEEIAARNGMTSKGVQELSDHIWNAYGEMIEESRGDFTSLKTDWGNDFDNNVKIAHEAYKTGLNVNDPRIQRFEQKFGNDPDAVFAFANMANKFGIKSDSLQGPTQTTAVGKSELTQQAVAKTQAAMNAIKENKYNEAEKLQTEARELYARASSLN